MVTIMLSTFQKVPSILDTEEFKHVLDICTKKVSDPRLETILRFYFSALDQTFKSDREQPGDDWIMYPARIRPTFHVIQKQVAIGAEIDFYFTSPFQNEGVSIRLFTVTCINFFNNESGDDATRTIPEARFDLRKKIVPDTRIADLMMYVGKYYERIDATLKAIWIEQILPSISPDDGAKGQPSNATTERAVSGDPGLAPVQPSQQVAQSPIINAMPPGNINNDMIPTLGSRKPGIMQSPSESAISKKESAPVTTVKRVAAPAKPVAKATSSAAPEKGDAGKEGKDDDDDQSSKIFSKFKEMSSVPDIDDDDDMPTMTPEMSQGK